MDVEMPAEDRSDAVEGAGLDQGPGPGPDFLRGLEDQPDGPGWRIGGQELGRAEEHGGVPVVAAGVHHAGVLGSEGKSRLLGDRERVDVGTKGDPGPAALARDFGEDARATDPAGA
jgi:hypothetical protein